MKLAFRAKNLQVSVWTDRRPLSVWLVTHLDTPGVPEHDGRPIRLALSDTAIDELIAELRLAQKTRKRTLRTL